MKLSAKKALTGKILLWYKRKDIKKKGTDMRQDIWKIRQVKDLKEAERRRLRSIGIEFSDFSDYYILPGFTDVHVHLREPGFLYKETIETGTGAAAAGGFTDIFSMPNLKPCSDSLRNLKVQTEAIKRRAIVRVHPYGALTRNEEGRELAAMEELAPYVIGFSDDGRGVMDDMLMEKAMIKAKALKKVVAAHCEDESFPRESSQAECKQLERDLRLVRKTGCAYHMCHVSTKESLRLIREAKEEGLDVTCETAPHYLVFSSETIEKKGNFKMNPPIKGEEDRQALLEALRDGVIDMIGTDHAPHSREEKEGAFEESAYGIVGLETAFPVLYTEMVLGGIISMERLMDLMYINPGKRFGLPVKSLEEELKGGLPDFSLWDLDEEYTVDPERFISKGKSSPFEGRRVIGRCAATVSEGRPVWIREEIK